MYKGDIGICPNYNPNNTLIEYEGVHCCKPYFVETSVNILNEDYKSEAENYQDGKLSSFQETVGQFADLFSTIQILADFLESKKLSWWQINLLFAV